MKTIKPNLTERQTNRIANRMYAHIQNNWWKYVNDVMKAYDETDLNDADFINISKSLAEMLHEE